MREFLLRNTKSFGSDSYRSRLAYIEILLDVCDGSIAGHVNSLGRNSTFLHGQLRLPSVIECPVHLRCHFFHFAGAVVAVCAGETHREPTSIEGFRGNVFEFYRFTLPNISLRENQSGRSDTYRCLDRTGEVVFLVACDSSIFLSCPSEARGRPLGAAFRTSRGPRRTCSARSRGPPPPCAPAA